MRYALSADSQEALREFAASGAVFAFDFDGTLAPIVNRPSGARMRRSTLVLLRRLCAREECIAISGRSRAELLRLVEGAGFALAIGNHGAEPWEGAAALRRKVKEWSRALVRALPAVPGLWVEDKKLSLTVHYRMCRDQAGAHTAVLEAARGLTGARLVEGKCSLALVSPDAPHKGDALVRAMTKMKLPRAIYTGDEDTDEDAFALARTGAVFGIRVGRRKRSEAGYFLRRQEEVDALLRVMIGLRRGC